MARDIVTKGPWYAVASIVKSSRILHHEIPRLIKEIDSMPPDLEGKESTSFLADVMAACGSSGYQTPYLDRKIEFNAKRLVNNGMPSEIAIIALALAKNGVEAPRFFSSAFARDFGKVDGDLELATATDLCYAFAIQGLEMKAHPPNFIRLWDAAMGELSSEDKTVRRSLIGKLVTAYRIASAEGIQGLHVPEEAKRKLECNTVASSEKDGAEVIAESLKQRLLHAGIEAMLDPDPNAPFPDAFLRIDMAFPQQKVAVQLKGPFSYLKELGSSQVTRIPRGHTKAKRRYFEQLGWKVVEIDFRDWRMVQKQGEPESWLWQQLKDAVGEEEVLRLGQTTNKE